MKNLVFLFAVLVSVSSGAQMCPGGGVDFSSAVAFDPNWIYGCNTGTSCNGGVTFDNKTACQPTTALDACAPAPSCGTAGQNGSNIWFKFYPLGPTATISCFQNSSLVITIQAFSGGPACGSLTEIGCAKAGGPSSGVQLNLTGLQPGQLYYFRIFGSANPVSQRTGIYCFCGTTGINNVVLPVALTSFRGYVFGDKIDLVWTTSQESNCRYFEVERSRDGSSFAAIARVDGTASGADSFTYSDEAGVGDTNFYRIKMYTNGDDYTYSNIISIKPPLSNGFHFFFDNDRKELQITVQKPTRVAIVNASGQLLKTLSLVAGRNSASMAGLAPGIYFLHDTESDMTKRFCVF